MTQSRKIYVLYITSLCRSVAGSYFLRVAAPFEKKPKGRTQPKNIHKPRRRTVMILSKIWLLSF